MSSSTTPAAGLPENDFRAMGLKDLFDRGREIVGGEYPSPRERDALLGALLSDVLHLQPYSRFTDPSLELPASACDRFLDCARRLSRGEPLQYITGRAVFCGRSFAVSPAVLIPRPETEELCRMIIDEAIVKGGTDDEAVSGGAGVETVVEGGADDACDSGDACGFDDACGSGGIGGAVRAGSSAGGTCGAGSAGRLPKAAIRILDLCTGSGCIAWTLALDVPGAEVWAVDISEDALKLARAQTFSGSAPHFVRCDVLCGPSCGSAPNVCIAPAPVGVFGCSACGSPVAPGGFDIIVSNPPYVRDSERALMRRNVLEHEPSLALFVPDGDPLVFYRAIRRWADALLRPGGRLYLEQNEFLAAETAAIFNGSYRTETRNDLSDKPRFTVAERL